MNSKIANVKNKEARDAKAEKMQTGLPFSSKLGNSYQRMETGTGLPLVLTVDGI